MITITFRFHVIEKMCKLRYKQYLILYGGEIIEFEGEAARRKPCDGGPAATRTKGVSSSCCFVNGLNKAHLFLSWVFFCVYKLSDYQPELDTWLMSCLS